VDNNSTDQTRQVVESFVARGHRNLRYVFEGRQGVSYGRNAGIAHAAAPIIAFTDDDMRVTQDWVAAIKRAFDDHPEVDFVGGKILPQFKREPPKWLTHLHWLPLGGATYGEQSYYTNKENRIDFSSGNLALRSSAFELVGLFAPELQRVKDGIGSCEDYELQARLWDAGCQGMYAPDAVAYEQVPEERMLKAYHRRWYTSNGKFSAHYRRMRLRKLTRPEGEITRQVNVELRFFGVPILAFRSVIIRSINFLVSIVRLRPMSRVFYHELCLRRDFNYVRESYRLYAAERKHSHLAEVGAFAKALLRSRGRSYVVHHPETESLSRPQPSEQ